MTRLISSDMNLPRLLGKVHILLTACWQGLKEISRDFIGWIIWGRWLSWIRRRMGMRSSWRVVLWIRWRLRYAYCLTFCRIWVRRRRWTWLRGVWIRWRRDLLWVRRHLPLRLLGRMELRWLEHLKCRWEERDFRDIDCWLFAWKLFVCRFSLYKISMDSHESLKHSIHQLSISFHKNTA